MRGGYRPRASGPLTPRSIAADYTAAMDRAPIPWINRRSLYEGRLFEIGHVTCRPTPEIRHEVDYPSLNVLALPIAGVFALHEGPRKQLLATPNHAVFISSGVPYKVTFPGNVGDDCLTMRLTPEGLSQLVPQAMAGDGFDASIRATRAALPPAAILARGLLTRQLLQAETDPRLGDPLLIEELGVGLLDCALGAEYRLDPPKGRHVERAKEAMATAPERKWALAELAGIACVSPSHLAHAFSREVGTSVYRYAIRLRLARALDAVLDSNIDLTSIALDSGFASHSHFTARFRAFFGLTPDALRRSARSGQAAELRRIVTALPALAA